MQIPVLVLLIGLFAGMAIGLQGPLSSMINQRTGMLESSFIVHLSGAIASLVPLLILGGGRLAGWREVPWYALAAGVPGVVLISAFGYLIPRIGTAATIILVVAGQLVISSFLDHFGLLETEVRRFDLSRLIGFAVLFLGIWLVVR